MKYKPLLLLCFTLEKHWFIHLPLKLRYSVLPLSGQVVYLTALSPLLAGRWTGNWETCMKKANSVDLRVRK